MVKETKAHILESLRARIRELESCRDWISVEDRLPEVTGDFADPVEKLVQRVVFQTEHHRPVVECCHKQPAVGHNGRGNVDDHAASLKGRAPIDLARAGVQAGHVLTGPTDQHGLARLLEKNA